MKISFPKYGPGELLTRKQGATRIISFVVIAFFVAVCGTYLLTNKLWLLTIAVLGIAGILLFLGAAAAIFLKQNQVNELPSGPIEENVPRITTQWDYQPRRARRARAALDSPSTETSDGLSSDPFGTNDNVWLNDNSIEGVDPTFINGPPEVEESRTKPLSQTTDTVSAAPTVQDASVSK
ncbi:MAG TPA: hypothetical protein VK475_09345 [Pyrinomonadaceae bacterium]|nr:hypothetical protein [Pyrinomonadaceae bacterium]